MTIDTVEQHEALISALLDEQRWPQGGSGRQRIDTHISTVLLAGDHAYKIKKPLDLGFLNFRSLQARRVACDEELRLNRRLAPAIYQAVCAITGGLTNPRIDGEGSIIDWAVRMRRFDPDAVLSNPEVAIDETLIDQLAHRVAAFHAAAPAAEQKGQASLEAGGSLPEIVAMFANFDCLRTVDGTIANKVQRLERWTRERVRVLRPVLQRRRQKGCVRECHGDLHLGNIALIDSEPVVFDAIEFDPDLRWIDVINDIAFLTMDLCRRGMDGLAYRFIDRYLAAGGDYAALHVLQFYEVYRALVRAKIAAIRMQQVDDKAQGDEADEALQRYLDLGARLAETRRGALLITHGVSGSGKSYATAGLAQHLSGVRLRSDVERKRLLGLAADADASTRGGYGANVTARTYLRLAELAAEVIAAGYTAIVDATFLERADRLRFAALAADHEVSFAILDCTADRATLRARIVARRREAGNVSDADLSVLDRQMARVEPLTAGERAVSLPVSPDKALDRSALAALLQAGSQSA